jgi:hypothetical protein
VGSRDGVDTRIGCDALDQRARINASNHLGLALCVEPVRQLGTFVGQLTHARQSLLRLLERAPPIS